MKVTVERARTAEVAGPRASRGRAAQHHSDPRQRADPGGQARRSPSRRPTSISRSPRRSPPRSAPGGSTTVPAHMFYEIVRKLPEGAQIVLEASGDRAVLAIRAGRSRFTLQTLPESDFPDLAAGDMTHTFKLARRRSQAPDRQDPVRDLDRGDALLPQRHLPAHRRHRQSGDAARGGDRRPSPGAGRAAAAGGRRRHAGRHRAAQDGGRGAAPDRGQRRPRSRSSCRRARSASRSATWC